MKVVGARLPRYDGVGHVTGRSTYVDDVRPPGMLHAVALRSPHHNAQITRLDVGAAEAKAGVHAVVTHADVPLLVHGHLSGAGIPRRRAAAGQGLRPLPGPADRPGGRRHGGHRPGGVRRHRSRLQGAAGSVRRAPRVRRRRPGRQRHLRQLVRPVRGEPRCTPDPQGRRRSGLRRRRSDRVGRVPHPVSGAGAARDPSVRRHTGARRSPHHSHLHSGHVLLARRGVCAPANADEPGEDGGRHRGRRLRRQGRHPPPTR